MAVTIKKDGGVELITSAPSKLGYLKKLVKEADEIIQGAGYSDFHLAPASKTHRKRGNEIIPQKQISDNIAPTTSYIKVPKENQALKSYLDSNDCAIKEELMKNAKPLPKPINKTYRCLKNL